MKKSFWAGSESLIQTTEKALRALFKDESAPSTQNHYFFETVQKLRHEPLISAITSLKADSKGGVDKFFNNVFAFSDKVAGFVSLCFISLSTLIDYTFYLDGLRKMGSRFKQLLFLDVETWTELGVRVLIIINALANGVVAVVGALTGVSVSSLWTRTEAGLAGGSGAMNSYLVADLGDDEDSTKKILDGTEAGSVSTIVIPIASASASASSDLGADHNRVVTGECFPGPKSSNIAHNI
jgi:hypothetical protein